MFLNSCAALLLFISSVYGICNPKDCPTIPKHYEELSCKPIKKAGDCCTTSFDCPDFLNRDHGKCYFKNQTLSPGDVLQNFQQVDTCENKCYCRIDRSGAPSEIYCSRQKCSIKSLVDQQQVQTCLKQYDANHCCPVRSVCDKEINKLATCEFESRSYREGEKMYPKNFCYKCYCSKTFNNKTAVPDNKDCHKIDCGIALTKIRRIAEGCIPVYIKTDDCCPIGWRCPGEKHMKVNGTAKVDDSKTHCKFGNMKIKVGASLDLGGDNCQECKCTMPPMLHCIQTCYK